MSLKKLVERAYNKPIDEILRELYVEKNMTQKELAKELTVAQKTIQNWLCEYDIYRPKNIGNKNWKRKEK